MIRGYFSHAGNRKRPFVNAVFRLPVYSHTMEVPLLLDTGADRTVLSPFDGRRLARAVGIDLASLPQGTPSAGIGGRVRTCVADAILFLDEFIAPLSLAILEPLAGPVPSIPSLLGRDILSQFGLFVDERTERVLLLAPDEVDALPLP